ncbi:MAG: class I SAM-dependent methyltransferase [Myxococcota bacterium]
MDAETFLREFHDTNPGATPASFQDWTLSGDHRSSYDWLADVVVEAADGEVVLDLACGDGFLLEKMLGRPNPPGAVIGADLSGVQLKRARRRIKKRAAWHHGPAQTLKIPAGELGAVSCHLALMLMNPVEPVLDVVATGLLPGGVFCAVVPALIGRNAVAERIEASIWSHHPTVPAMGDPRTTSVEGLQALLAPRFARVQITPSALTKTATAATLWETFRRSYDSAALSAPDRAAVRQKICDTLGDEPVECAIGVLLIQAWTA